MECPHCPEHDEHLEPNVLIVLGPLAVGLLECPRGACSFRLPFKILHVEI